MIDAATSQISDSPAEIALREELTRADEALGAIGPVLGQLIGDCDLSMFSEEILARVRNMVDHLARQLLMELALGARHGDAAGLAEHHGPALGRLLADHTPLLTHCHALALEWQLARTLVERGGPDLVLTPLLQSLIASEDGDTAAIAMTALAAQARFASHQQRMELPLAELPADLFHQALLTLSAFVGESDAAACQATDARLRAEYDERRGRAALFDRLIMGLAGGPGVALSIGQAGLGLFLSAVALGSGLDRDVIAASTVERQHARMLLALRAAGLPADDAAGAYLLIHPDLPLPEGWERLDGSHAAALLARNHAGEGRMS